MLIKRICHKTHSAHIKTFPLGGWGLVYMMYSRENASKIVYLLFDLDQIYHGTYVAITKRTFAK